MARVGLTIPTRFSHPELLAGILDNCGLEPDDICIVDTRDLPLNIHEWWNHGIAVLEDRCDYVAVLNDDVVINEGTLPGLARVLDHGYTLAAPGSTGWCWMLNVHHGVRPDETYVWWYGDNQLWHDAAQANGVGYAPGVYVRHVHGNKATEQSPVLQALARKDMTTWQSRQLSSSTTPTWTGT